MLVESASWWQRCPALVIVGGSKITAVSLPGVGGRPFDMVVSLRTGAWDRGGSVMPSGDHDSPVALYFVLTLLRLDFLTYEIDRSLFTGGGVLLFLIMYMSLCVCFRKSE